MRLHQAQATIAKDRHRFRVICAGRRFGKTAYSAEEIKGKALANSVRIAYIAPTLQQARDIAWATLKKELFPVTLSTNENRLEITIRTISGGESIIFLRGWENIETLRGQAFDLLIIDEVAMMRDFWMNWQEILRPTLTDRKGEAIFVSTPKGFNHFYELYNKELEDTDFKSFHFTSYDNPFLPAEELEIARKQLTPTRFEQEYMANFTKVEGLVYKEFDRKKHLYDELPAAEYTKLGGIDFGYTNPAAVVHVYQRGDRFYVEDEWYKTQRTDAQIAEYVKGCEFDAVFPDPEAPAAIEELRNLGLNVREVSKGKDSVVNGIDKVRELFLTGRLMINQKCKNVLFELESYSYDDKGGEKPLKENDHLCVSGNSLVATTNGEIPIKELVGKDGYVYSYDEVSKSITVKKFSNVKKTGNRETIKIKLSGDRELVLTPDHPVMLRSGEWIDAGELAVGDSLMPLYQTIDSHGHLRINLNNGNDEFAHRLVWNSINEPIHDTWTNNIHHKDLDKLNNNPDNLEMMTRAEHCGLHARLRKNPNDDTRAKLREAQQRIYLDKDYKDRAIQNLLNINHLAKAWHASDEGIRWHRKHGKESWNGRQKTQKQCVQCGKDYLTACPSRSKFCGNNCKAKYDRNRRKDIYGIPDSKRYKLQRVGAWNHRVIGIEAGDKIDVFNMNVDGTHNFACDGVIVHNCDALRYIIMTADVQVDRAKEESKIQQVRNERKNEFF